MKVLNLDDLAKVERVVTLTVAGEARRFEIKEMSVEGFIEYTSMANRLEGDKVKELSLAENIEMSIKTIRLAMPDCPPEVLKTLNIAQLTALVQFINGELDKETNAGAVSHEEEGEAKKS